MSELIKNDETINHNQIQEDEIDLKELFLTILKYKYKIVIFVFLVSFCTLWYVLSIPNSYKSEVILAPQSSDNNKVGGGLSTLASFAGISLGGGGSVKDPFVMIQTMIKDYEFNSYVIKKYDLAKKLANQKNLVYAFGFDFFKPDAKELEDKSDEQTIFNTYLKLKKIISVSSDKKSSLITLSAELNDRVLAKQLVDIYLNESIEKIKQQDMKEIDKQIIYYNKELANTYDVSLKEQLSKSLSSLMQKKVFSLANDYYFVSKITDSRVANIKEKTKPKRGLILVVSFVTSFILAIFLVFFYEFIRQDKDEAKA
ncbi:MAG: Wzz/FepE/Etk N-terminal domain-containing protein [Halarcobacter sp.]